MVFPFLGFLGCGCVMLYVHRVKKAAKKKRENLCGQPEYGV
jgi:hypothetical protein